MSVEVKNRIKKIQLIDVYGKIITKQCYIQIFLMNKNINTNTFKHRNVICRGLDGCEVLIPPPDEYVWIVLGKTRFDSKSFHIICIRSRSNITDKRWNDKYARSLYNTISSKIPNNGLDVVQSSGSNGITSYENYNILHLLKSNKAFISKRSWSEDSQTR